MDDYKDIINVNWSDISFKHPRMTIYNRSGIFAPFSALSGYKEEIGETERVTDSKVELSEDYKDIINNKLINLDINKDISIEYFIKDSRKSGGKYITKTGRIKKIDYIRKEII